MEQRTDLHARITWSILDRSKTKSLLCVTRSNLRKIVASISRHCKFGSHALRLGLQYNDYCRSCPNINMEESTLPMTLTILGPSIFDGPSELLCEPLRLDHLKCNLILHEDNTHHFSDRFIVQLSIALLFF